jgi:hypothetical protein
MYALAVVHLVWWLLLSPAGCTAAALQTGPCTTAQAPGLPNVDEVIVHSSIHAIMLML